MAQIPTDRNLMSPMGNLSIAVAIGAIPGWTSFRKFGLNPAVNGAGTTEDMWPIGTPRVLPAAGAVASLVSDSAADDGSPEGTGAHIVKVEGLDDTWTEISEEVTLNGVGAVTTTAEFYRINRMYIVKVGSGGVNAGNITASISGAAQAYIEAGEGQTHQTLYTVPAGKTLIVDLYNVGIGRMAVGDADIDGQINLYNEARGELEGWRSISAIYLYNGQSHVNHSSVLLPAKTELRIQITSTSATQAFGIFGGYLVDETVGIYLYG